MSGWPTFSSDPPTQYLQEGMAWYNSTANQLKYYDGSSIQTVSIGTGNWSGLGGKPFLVVSPAGPTDGGDYGPNTPGTTTAGIQEAVNALTTGGMILIAKGSYTLTSTVNLTSGIKIMGASAMGDSTFGTILNLSGAISCFTIATGKFFIEISDLYIFGTGASTQNGIKVTGGSDYWFHDIFINNLGIGVYVVSAGGVTDIHSIWLTNMEIEGVGTACIIFDSTAGGVSTSGIFRWFISGCVLQGNVTGYLLGVYGNSTKKCHEGVIVGCRVEGLGSGYGMRFSGSEDITVSACQVEDSTAGGFHLTGSAKNITINGCRARAYKKAQNYGVVLDGADSCNITGGDFSGNTTGPINLTAGQNLLGSFSNVLGLNPQGFATTTPAFPASATDVQNQTGYPVRVYMLTAGTVTVYQVTDPAGTAQAVTASLIGGEIFELEQGAKIQFTYTVAPTWKWYGE